VEAAWSRSLTPAYGHLFVLSDGGGWVLDHEAQEIGSIARDIGLRVHVGRGVSRHARQCCHQTSQFALTLPRWFEGSLRLSVDYFHGDPTGDAQFGAIYDSLKRNQARLERVRVAHSGHEALLLQAGLEPHRVRRIPIGVNLALFPRAAGEARTAARRELGLPEQAVVVGSFQKDGVGWGEGLEPKLIKGPDVLLEALGRLVKRVPELWVLLTGPARGYVRRGLEARGIPYRHHVYSDYSRLATCYAALDAYLVTSRDEGGPKAVLEALATGTPLVTTPVGQAQDLVRHGENGLMVPSEDAEGLAYWVERAVGDSGLRARLASAGRATAEQNALEAQRPLWRSFFAGWVEGP